MIEFNMQMKDAGWQNGLAAFKVKKGDNLVIMVRKKTRSRHGWVVHNFIKEHAGWNLCKINFFMASQVQFSCPDINNLPWQSLFTASRVGRSQGGGKLPTNVDHCVSEKCTLVLKISMYVCLFYVRIWFPWLIQLTK